MGGLDVATTGHLRSPLGRLRQSLRLRHGEFGFRVQWRIPELRLRLGFMVGARGTGGVTWNGELDARSRSVRLQCPRTTSHIQHIAARSAFYCTLKTQRRVDYACPLIKLNDGRPPLLPSCTMWPRACSHTAAMHGRARRCAS